MVDRLQVNESPGQSPEMNILAAYMKTPRSIFAILITAFLIETACVTYGLYIPGITGLLSVLHTLSGLVIAWALLFTSPAATHFTLKSFALNAANRYRWLLTGMMLLMMLQQFFRWETEIPVDFHDADMLPVIRTMCQRFLSGQRSHIYDIIPEIWGGMQPVYLPAMWMPFAIPIGLGIDMRWITVVMFFFVFCFFIWKIDTAKKHAPFVLGGCFLLFWWLFMDEKAWLIPYTEEGVVVFFYVLLVMALHRQNAWLTGFAVSLCVLSRYVLIGWIPAYLIFLVYRKQYRDLVKLVVTGIVCFLLLVIIPFGWNMVHAISELPGKYIGFAGRVWQDSPHIFFESLGWAKFFGAQKIEQMHKMLVYFSLLVPVITMLIGLELHKRYRIPAQNLPLVILKLAMVIFYTFVDVPYLYLFYTSSYVSLIAITYFIMQEDEKPAMR